MWNLDDPEVGVGALEDEEFGFKPHPPPLSTHCNVPLKYNKQRAAIGKPSYGQHVSPHNQYKREYKLIQEISGHTHPKYYDLCHFQEFLLNRFNPPSNMSALAEFEQQTRVSSNLWRLQSMALQSHSSDGINFSDYTLDESQTKILQTYYLRKAFFEEVVLSTGSPHFDPSLWWKKDHGITVFRSFEVLIIATKNLIYIEYEGINCLASRDHLLILSDLAAQRYLLLKYSLCAQLHPLQPFLPPGMLLEYFELGDKIIYHGGNEAYEIISKIEPLCMSHLVGDLPVGTSTGLTFKELILKEIISKAKELAIEQTIQLLIGLIEVAFNTSPAYITELYGLYRIWGHPTLEPLEGVSALKKVATPVRFTKYEYVDKITNKFKEEFICRYIAKEHVWPDLDMSQLPDSNVIKQAFIKKSVFPNKHKDYRRSDLKIVKFNKIFPIDPKFDLIELIADKALSLLTPDLIHQISESNNCGNSIQRSVLLNWLQSPIQDPEVFLNHIDQHGFPSVERSNGVREKEREEKLKPRMFGLMSLFKRMYIVLTEALLAEHILPYFPEITMIDDELSLDKKRYSFTKTQAQRDQIIISLDFAKWNSNMRKNETHPLFQCFDQMFGFINCFTRTHEMFETSAMYLLNGTYLPKIDGLGNLKPDFGCWYGHLGGIEGLRQKGWTIWTVILILLAAEGLDFVIWLLGQGDNQILKLLFALGLSEDSCNELLYKFLKNLDVILSNIGPPLKLEETWASRSLFVYGKYTIYKGVPLPMSGKRICRIFRLSNEDYPTLESSLSSATANLTSAVGSHYCIGPLFYIYLAEVVGILQLYLRSCYLQPQPLNQLFSKMSKVKIPGSPSLIKDVPSITKNQFLQSDVLYESLCLFPRSLGGFPILNIYNCLIRGFPDEVSFDLASLKIFYPMASPHIQKVIKRYCSPPIMDSKNFQLLSEHPTVLNLEIPPAPGESRRNLIIQFLKSGDIIVNNYVKTFLDLLDSKEDENVLESLVDIQPFNPRILSLFMDATTESRARHIAGKLQKTKTIATIAREISNLDLHSKIAEAERNHLASIFRLMSKDHSNTIPWNSDMCSISHSDNLREISWGKKLVGINCVPPHEFIQIDSNPVNGLTSDIYETSKGYVTIRYDCNYKDPLFKSPFLKGQYAPYRGSITRQKVSGYGDQIASQADPIIQKVLRLFSLVGWGIPKYGNLHQLAINLLARHTDLSHEELCPPDEEISGSVHHRLQDMRTGHGGSVSSLPNYGTKFMFDTFPLIAYSKGSKNVNLMFQSFMSFAVMIEGEKLSHGYAPKFPVTYIFVKNSCCVQEIVDDLCEIPFPPNPISIHDPNNPYLYVPKNKLMILIEKGIRFSINRNLSLDIDHMFLRFHSILAEECFHLLSPHSWDRATMGFRTQQLVINWVLPSNIGMLFHNLALRLCAHYTGAIREKSSSSFLTRVAERIERSPIEHWKSLVALIFAKNIHHHICGPMIFCKVSGNPLCSEDNFSVMIKESIVNIILIWSSNPKSRISLNSLDHYGRPYCGLSQHPSLLHLTSSWLLNDISTPVFITLRYAIINKLTSKSSGYFSSHIVNLINYYIDNGIKKISGESLDYLCKREYPEYELDITSPKSSDTLVDGGESILSFSNSHLILGSSSIAQEDVVIKHNYLYHLSKIASLPTTGSYKCLSILKSLYMYNPTTIACLGDGGGGFTLASLLFYKNANVFFNTLITNESPIQQSSPIPFIPALAGHPELEDRIIGKFVTTDIISDITHPVFASTIVQLVSPSFDIIMCDAETSLKESLTNGVHLINGCLRLGRLSNCQILIFKTYLANISLISIQIAFGLSQYNQVSLFRSDFSTIGNTEIYLIFSEPKLCTPMKKMSDTQWVGHILNPSNMNKLYEWRTYLSSGPYKDISNQSQIYTSIISTTETNLLTELMRHLPFCKLNESLNYPITISNWILDTSSKITGTPQITRVRLETITLHYSFIKRWVVGYLSLLILSNLEKWIWSIEEYINRGVFIWYRLKNKTWDTSLYFNAISISKDESFKVFPLSTIIHSQDIKLIYRLVGLCIHFNIKCENQNTEDSELRGPNIPGKDITIDPPTEAENSWIYHHIQSGTSLKQLIPESKPRKRPSQFYRRI